MVDRSIHAIMVMYTKRFDENKFSPFIRLKEREYYGRRRKQISHGLLEKAFSASFYPLISFDFSRRWSKCPL